MTYPGVSWKKLEPQLRSEGSRETRRDLDCNSAQTDDNQAEKIYQQPRKYDTKIIKMHLIYQTTKKCYNEIFKCTGYKHSVFVKTVLY